MKIYQILILLGAWVALMPQLGLPQLWKVILATLTGLGIIWIGYKMRSIDLSRIKKRTMLGTQVAKRDTFVEHVPEDRAGVESQEDVV